MKIGFLGIGKVGAAIATHLDRLGHEIIIADFPSNKNSAQTVVQQFPNFKLAVPQEMVNQTEIVFLAVPFSAAEQVVKSLNLQGKILVDCTNPIAPGIKHGLDSKISGSQFIQQLASGAKLVKAFSIYGYENFIDPVYPGYGDLKPLMMIAGDDADAKHTIAQICEAMGWQVLDTGNLENTLHLEHLTLLWVKMGRIQGKGPHFVWSILERKK